VSGERRADFTTDLVFRGVVWIETSLVSESKYSTRAGRLLRSFWRAWMRRRASVTKFKSFLGMDTTLPDRE
jgi:hypothetical protein